MGTGSVIREHSSLRAAHRLRAHSDSEWLRVSDAEPDADCEWKRISLAHTERDRVRVAVGNGDAEHDALTVAERFGDGQPGGDRNPDADLYAGILSHSDPHGDAVGDPKPDCVAVAQRHGQQHSVTEQCPDA